MVGFETWKVKEKIMNELHFKELTMFINEERFFIGEINWKKFPRGKRIKENVWQFIGHVWNVLFKKPEFPNEVLRIEEPPPIEIQFKF